MYRNFLKPSNPAYTIQITHEQILQKCGFPCTLQAVLSLRGIVIKCTATIFFLTEDCPGQVNFAFGQVKVEVWWCGGQVSESNFISSLVGDNLSKTISKPRFAR